MADERAADLTTDVDDERYAPPVGRLLTLGDARAAMADWPDYLQYGLGPEHVPDLIRLAIDPELNGADAERPEVWGTIHAWRARGQLRAVEAVASLLTLHDELEDSDWTLEELPVVYGLIGPPALPLLAAYLAEDDHDLWSRVAVSVGLAKIAAAFPEARDASIAAISRVLERHQENDETLNGSLISDLIDLQAVEAAPTIERAFAADNVDETIAGDWEDVQVTMGLLAERITPRPHRPLLPWGRDVVVSRSETTRPLTFDEDDRPLTPSSSPGKSKEARKAKSKRKAAAQSRRQNKKRK